MNPSTDSFKTKTKLRVAGKSYAYFNLKALQQAGLPDTSRLPFSLRILLENLLRFEDGVSVKREDVETLCCWNPKGGNRKEISFMPSRVLLQDFTGVPAVVDLAAMRDAVKEMGGDPAVINPLFPADLVIDHSVQVDYFGAQDSFQKNVRKEYERNRERYQFLKWGQKAFRNFTVVPPSTGIIHQVNLEYLARLVFEQTAGAEKLLFPDTVVGTDSHTTMINGLGVLGWGVGGIEAEAAMLGQPIPMVIPDVIGFKLYGRLREGVTTTDLVLTITQILRKKGVVGKFVEFFGEGLNHLDVPNRATIANMAPEYGATAGFFPIDAETIKFLKLTGRPKNQIAIAEAYAKAQGLYHSKSSTVPEYSDVLELDLKSVEMSIAGPKRPHDLVPVLKVPGIEGNQIPGTGRTGTVVIASITSCTNTSNPDVMLAAGILAKKAVERGLSVKPWVKTSLAPGSRVVMDYLKKAKLVKPLEALKFNLVGYGCATCIGNSGPLPENVSKEIKEKNLTVAAVLSGNRNFEGRIHSQVQLNYLASPPLVVAFAIAGTMNINFEKDALGTDSKGRPVFLKDIWPAKKEIEKALHSVTASMFRREYAHVYRGDQNWRKIPAGTGSLFKWQTKSTYVKRPPFLENLPTTPKPVRDILHARALAVLGDFVTTDHISPAGAIAKDGPAGRYLISCGVEPKDFNSYGARRGNFEVMARGTFANKRLQNFLVPETQGGVTKHFPDGEILSIYDASVKYQKAGVPLIVIAGKEYGSGSSRDWAAKGPALLGIQTVIAESFERIHRSNLIGMGILPLQFLDGENRETLGLVGDEIFSISGITGTHPDGKGCVPLSPGKKLKVIAEKNGQNKEFFVHCRIDAPTELSYYQNGGVLPFVLRNLIGTGSPSARYQAGKFSL